MRESILWLGVLVKDISHAVLGGYLAEGFRGRDDGIWHVERGEGSGRFVVLSQPTISQIQTKSQFTLALFHSDETLQ